MTRRREYKWRFTRATFDGLVRDAQREELLVELRAAGPQAVCAGLLAYVLARNWNPGWAVHAFKEIFGAWPRPQDRRVVPKPLPNFLIEEWVASRKRKPRPCSPDLFAMRR